MTLLSAALQSNPNRSSFLFHGPPSCGKATAARMFAACLLDDFRPLKVSHPDFHIYRAGAGSDLRYWKSAAHYRPYEGGLQVFLVEDVDKLNEGDTHALLTDIEEPPEDTIYILTASSASALLDTITSRCISIPFLPLDFDTKVRIIEEKGVGSVIERAVFAPSLADAIGSDNYTKRRDEFLAAKKVLTELPSANLPAVVEKMTEIHPRALAELLLALREDVGSLRLAETALDMLSNGLPPEDVSSWLVLSLIQQSRK